MQSRSRISGMLSHSFKPQKCKTSLKLAVSRIKLLKNKREEMVKLMRRNLAQLLESGQEQTARLRVEHVIREEKTTSAYELIEIYCEIIDSRLPIIESQKNCPIDLKEAVSSVIYASPRCADIPELMDISKHFTAKYGKDFVKAALEIRPDCGVSRMMVEKLSANAPDIQTKIKVLNEIAKEHGIKWEPKAFEEQAQKPKDDLLSGPSSFSTMDKTEIKSSDTKASFAGSQSNESIPKVYQNNMATQPQAVKSTLAKEESVSFHSSWNMEFKDATSAAEAAAQSAERASMAARAAAELASRGNVSRPSSGGSYEQSAYVVKNEGPQSMKNSYVGSNDTSHLKASEDTSPEDSHFVNQKEPDLQKDDLVRTNKLAKDQTFNNNPTSRENLTSEKTRLAGLPVVNATSGKNLHEDNARPYHYVQESISDLGPASKIDNVDTDHDVAVVDDDSSLNYEHRPSMFPSFHSDTLDEYKTVDYHEDKTEADSSAGHYDDYNSDNDDHWRHRESNLLDSFLPQQSNGPSNLLSNVDSWSQKESVSGFMNNEINSQSHQTDYSDKTKQADLHSDSDDNLPPKYNVPKYDSDQSSSESEDEMENPNFIGHGRSSNFVDTDSSSSKVSLAARPSHGAHLMDDTIALDSSNQRVTVFHDEENLELERDSNDKSRRSDLNVRNSHQFRSIGKSHSNDAGGGSTEEESVNTLVSDEGYESGILNFGRLSGGFRNKGNTRPPYVRNISADVSSRATMNSEDISLNDDEITISTSEFSTSIEATSEGKTSGHLHTNTSGTKFRASLANVDTSLDSEEQFANRSSDDSSATGRSIYSQYRRSSEDLVHPVQESHLQQQERKEYKESNSRSSLTNYIDREEEQTYSARVRQSRDSISTSGSQKSNISPSTQKSTDSEITNQRLNSQILHARASYGSKSRVPINDSNFGNQEAEELELQTASMSGNNKSAKLSRRTRPIPSVAKEDKVPNISEPVKESKTSLLNSEGESSSAKIKHSKGLQDRDSSKPRQSQSSAEEPSMKHSQTEPSVVSGHSKLPQDESRRPSVKENEKSTMPSSDGKSISREISSKNLSHVHPRLPDYDSIAAHFQSLRANVHK
ncbi:uncharacterized protein LOC122012126 [Zingiber officinale]|uniref:uncharacterized protein LOC122012126 n=1 Tax=Zingiber officinale TaxID=94328 RepID=UPI001C4D1E68|nr:uncharacterized protein LOC122012126 [Zingiber officinale]